MDHKQAISHIQSRLELELPSHLLYHGHHHTIDVLEATERIAAHEGVSGEEVKLLLVAAAYHDSGFVVAYKDHEEIGCGIASEILPEFGFSQGQIAKVNRMIMATKIPQNPTGPLSDILCDADLDYLGRNDFDPISDSLYQELKNVGIVTDVQQWNRIQLGFLTEHVYHTSYGKTFCQPLKEQHLNQIKSIVNGYS